jgi:DHA1 family bicyclomycin/chloramphenicol resistance-like MFS transporter
MFAYISGGSYVLENVYRISPQAFSAVFAANSIGLIVVSQLSSQVVTRVGPQPLLRLGLCLTALFASTTLIVCAFHGQLWLLIGSLFLLVCCQGLVLPNGMAAAMGGQPSALGSAAGLIGLGQFGIAALIAPLVGVGGAADALPMGVVMVVCAGLALSANLALVRSAAAGPRSRAT